MSANKFHRISYFDCRHLVPFFPPIYTLEMVLQVNVLNRMGLEMFDEAVRANILEDCDKEPRHGRR